MVIDMSNLDIKQIDVCDMKDFHIGSAEDFDKLTGVTVISSKDGATASVDVRGGGPATRETDLLSPENMVQAIHAVVLSGGSAYGLEASSGVMDYLASKDIGFDVGVGKVPIVCGASLFDLQIGQNSYPNKDMGYSAARNAYEGENIGFKQGNFGAGTGATVGKYNGIEGMMKSGIGSSAVQIGELQVGAISAVNAMGDVFDFDGKEIAGLMSSDGKLLSTCKAMKDNIYQSKNVFSGNTTISCIMTNAVLTKAQCKKLASICHDAYARRIKPVHTSVDGDTIFVMSSGTLKLDDNSFDALAVIATEELEKAIVSGVKSAKGILGTKSYSDL